MNAVVLNKKNFAQHYFSWRHPIFRVAKYGPARFKLWANYNRFRFKDFNIEIDPKLFSSRMMSEIMTGNYEGPELDLVSQTVSSDDRVLDIGCGIGIVALTAAKKCRGGATLVAIEANPNLIPIIKKNFQINGLSIDLRHGAASLGSGEVEFFIDHEFWASSLQASPTRRATSVKVPVVNFQALLDEITPTYLIMDVEGAEVELLSNFISGSLKRICVEVHHRMTGYHPILVMKENLQRQGFVLKSSMHGESVLYFEKIDGDNIAPEQRAE